MRTRFLQFLLALALCVVMAPVTASAYKGNDKDKDKDQDRHADRDHARDNDNDRDHRVRQNYRDNDRDNRAARPAGWNKGNKTGWGNCNLPPGQAKKNGGCNNGRRDRDDRRVATSRNSVRSTNSGTLRRDANGRLIVRRNAVRKDDQNQK